MNERPSESFKEFEQAGWEAAHQQYEKSFASLTAQAIPHILRVLEVRAPMRLLDVACGPGHLVGAASAILGEDGVVGIDFSTQMVTAASRNYPGLVIQEGDAENLTPIADGTFDVVAMNYGIMHLGEPERALREFHRVLKPGGRAAFTVWCPPNQAKGFEIVRQAIGEFGEPTTPVPAAPDMFHYSDVNRCLDVLVHCGFSRPSAEVFEQTWQLDSPAELFNAYLHGTARTGGLLQRQAPEKLEEIRAAVERRAFDLVRDDRVTIPMPAIVAWGTKV